MTSIQPHDVRVKLKALEAQLDQEDQLGAQSQKTVTLDQQAQGRLSRQDALQQQAMAKATQIRRDQMRQRIKNAYTRLAEGEYGFCTECGDEIGFKRLSLDPTIPTCVSCARG